MSTPQIRVAFVDDEPRTLRAFQWEFGEHFHIKTFLEGSELLTALNAGEQFDVLISDQRMPGMTGDEVLKCVLGCIVPEVFGLLALENFGIEALVCLVR